jgi:hypothetical protein
LELVIEVELITDERTALTKNATAASEPMRATTI